MDDYRARKRPHTYDDYEERSSHSSKRTHYDSYGSHSSHSSPEFMFKVLCPSIHVGAVIGKGGSVIQQITDDTGANIKISQTEEYFPGTNDRVVCIIGRKNPLVMATTDIVERILEAIDKKSGNEPTEDGKPRGHEIRCIIPSTASGIVIGKGGSIIKQLAEASSTKIQLNNDDPFDTKERVISIRSYTLRNVVKGSKCVLEQILSDPDKAMYANNRASFAGSQHGESEEPSASPYPYSHSTSSVPHSSSHSQPQSHPQSHGTPPSQSHPSYAYEEESATYLPPIEESNFETNSQGPSYSNHHSHQQYAPPIAHSTSHGLAPQPRSQPPPVAGMPAGISAPTFSTDGTNIIMEIGIADTHLGSVLGKGGYIIKDIMGSTGVKIQISQKGEYFPGTNQRIMKVVGLQQQVQNALNIILSRVQTVTSVRPPV